MRSRPNWPVGVLLLVFVAEAVATVPVARTGPSPRALLARVCDELKGVIERGGWLDETPPEVAGAVHVHPFGSKKGVADPEELARLQVINNRRKALEADIADRQAELERWRSKERPAAAIEAQAQQLERAKQALEDYERDVGRDTLNRARWQVNLHTLQQLAHPDNWRSEGWRMESSEGAAELLNEFQMVAERLRQMARDLRAAAERVRNTPREVWCEAAAREALRAAGQVDGWARTLAEALRKQAEEACREAIAQRGAAPGAERDRRRLERDYERARRADAQGHLESAVRRYLALAELADGIRRDAAQKSALRKTGTYRDGSGKVQKVRDLDALPHFPPSKLPDLPSRTWHKRIGELLRRKGLDPATTALARRWAGLFEAFTDVLKDLEAKTARIASAKDPATREQLKRSTEALGQAMRGIVAKLREVEGAIAVMGERPGMPGERKPRADLIERALEHAEAQVGQLEDLRDLAKDRGELSLRVQMKRWVLEQLEALDPDAIGLELLQQERQRLRRMYLKAHSLKGHSQLLKSWMDQLRKRVDVFKLIRDLDDPDFATREKATQDLIKRAQEDEWVVRMLKTVCGLPFDQNPELVHRANHILDQVALARAQPLIRDLASPDAKTRDDATKALLALARQSEAVRRALQEVADDINQPAEAQIRARDILRQLRAEARQKAVDAVLERIRVVVGRLSAKGAEKQKVGKAPSLAEVRAQLLALLTDVRRRSDLPMALRDQLRRAIIAAYAKVGTRPIDEVLRPINELLERTRRAPATQPGQGKKRKKAG